MARRVASIAIPIEITPLRSSTAPLP